MRWFGHVLEPKSLELYPIILSGGNLSRVANEDAVLPPATRRQLYPHMQSKVELLKPSSTLTLTVRCDSATLQSIMIRLQPLSTHRSRKVEER